MKKKLQSRRLRYFFYIYSLSILTIFITYILFHLSFGTYQILVKVESEACEELGVRGDVLDIRSLNIFKKDLKSTEIGNIYKGNLPLSSKILSLSFCPRSEIRLKELNLIFRDESFDIKPNDLTWYCNGCDLDYVNGEVVAVSGFTKAELETSVLTNFFPKKWNVLYKLFRYLPYLIALSFVGWILIFGLGFDFIILSTTFFTGLIFLVTLYFFEKLRAVFPPPKISGSEPISSSQHLGVSIIVDYLAIILILITPPTLYFVHKLVGNMRKKK